MKPGERAWLSIAPFVNAVEIHDGAKVFLTTFTAVPERAGMLVAAHWCEYEVRNGGFYQFFWNSTGVLAPEALEAFRRIGMPGVAAVIEGAMSWFGPHYPRD